MSLESIGNDTDGSPMPTVRDSDGQMLHGHNGGVWEWTSTKFDGYDGFVPSKLYPGYSADFFDDKHWVVVSLRNYIYRVGLTR